MTFAPINISTICLFWLATLTIVYMIGYYRGKRRRNP